MERIKDMTNFIKSQNNMLIMLWDKTKGWSMICEDSNLVSNMQETPNLMMIRNIVIEDDRPQYDIFMKKINKYMEDDPKREYEDVNREYTAVRLKTLDSNVTYYNIDCRLEWDDTNLVKMMVMVSELDAEEVYRIHLAHRTTADQHSNVMNAYCKDIILKNPDKRYAVIQFDIAKFKVINEVYGEARGDEVLAFFVDALKIICTHEQAYARISNDVFMIITPYSTIDDIYVLIQNLDDTLLGFKEMNYTIFYGVSFIEDIKDGLRKYSDEAAMARQNIKGDALQHIEFYNNKLKENIFNKKFIEDNMERAIQNHEFVMYLQPKYSISQEKMVGAEALVRWFHPERGLIFPNDFIPVMEENGYIVKLDYFMWEEACKVIRKWTDSGYEPIPISVNVSRRHLRDDAFIQVLNNLLQKYNIQKEYLQIEITETLEEEKMHYGINLLKENGYKLLMDDFGSGYSSLNMLKDTKFDIIKIDRKFLQDFINSQRGQRIVEHTIKMTRAIGLDIIAEGVETQEQAAFLEQCGCDTAQGFYYARPMKEEDFSRKMNE